MKFEVDLNKLSDEKLELILDMKKKGLIRRVNNDIDKPVKTKREQMLDELEGKKPSAYPKGVSKYNPVVVNKRKRMNYEEVAKKMAHVVRTSNREWTLKNLILEACENRKSAGGSDYVTLRPLLEKHLHGIRKIKVGRTMIIYAPTSLVKGKRKIKLNISEERRQYMSNRGIYVTSMAKKLRAENPNLQYSEALRRSQIAFNEEHGFKKKEEIQDKQETKITDKVFPEMGVGSDPKILKDIILNIIQKKGELMFQECSYPLALKLSEWRDFCSKLMINSIKIADYFGVPNKFSLKTSGNDIVIVYS